MKKVNIIKLAFSIFGSFFLLTSCVDDGFEEFIAPTGNVNGIQPNTLVTSSYSTEDLTVFFNSYSTDAVSYFWDFGNGDTSTEANPNYTYPEPPTTGQYTVFLETVSSDGLVASDTIGVSPVLARFEVVSVVDSEVTLSNSSIGAVSYLWDFGDGETSEEENPVHTYQTSDDFTITLTATGFPTRNYSGDEDEFFDGPESSFKIEVEDVVLSTIPQFSAVVDEVDPTQVTFTDESINAVSWEWDFGDSSPVSNVQNPVYTYAVEGEYQVTLTTTNSANASKSITKTVNASSGVIIGEPVEIEVDDFEPVGGSNSGGYGAWRWTDRETYSNNPWASTSDGFEGRGAKWDDGHSRTNPSLGDVRTSYQALNVTPNAVYTLEFYSEVRTAGDYIEVLILDGHYDTPTSAIASTPLLDASTTDTSSAFVLNSVEFTANGTGEIAIMMSAFISDINAGQSVYLDKIRITPVGAN